MNWNLSGILGMSSFLDFFYLAKNKKKRSQSNLWPGVGTLSFVFFEPAQNLLAFEPFRF